MTTSGSTGQTFTLGGTAKAVDSGVTVTSSDTDMTGATETITNFQAGDTLNFTNTDRHHRQLRQWRADLDRQRHAEPIHDGLAVGHVLHHQHVKGTRTVDVVANDTNDTANATSNTGVDTVVVAIAAPVVTTSASTGQTFTLGGTAKAVDSGLTVTSTTPI